MVSVLGHEFVGFSARAWPPQYSPPSLCEQSELQCFASTFRQMFARCPLQGQRCRNRHVIWLKTAQRFFYILNALFIRIVLSLLTAYRSAENIFSDRSYKGCRQTGAYAFQRIWEQRRPNLGAETDAAGSRDGRGWDEIRHQIGKLYFPVGNALDRNGELLSRQ